MVAYELSMLLSKTAPPAKVLQLVRQCASTIVRNGGVVRKVENHGIRPLGYKVRRHQENHKEVLFIGLHAEVSPKVAFFDCNNSFFDCKNSLDVCVAGNEGSSGDC